MFKDQSTIQLNTRIDNSQWTSYDQSNDFSYNQAEKIVVLYKGEELYGSIPEIQEEVPEAILTSPSMNQQITTGSALMIEVDTNLKEEDVESIEFYIDGEQVTQINVKPYRYEFIVVEAKDYEIFCKVITREGLELITDSIWIKANKSDREILEE